MQLSEEDKRKIQEWIQDKCGAMRCICCGTGNWQMIEFPTIPLGYDIHTTRFNYHSGLPQVGIACKNCGHLVFFSPSVMGFKPDKPQPPDSGEKVENNKEE